MAGGIQKIISFSPFDDDSVNQVTHQNQVDQMPQALCDANYFLPKGHILQPG